MTVKMPSDSQQPVDHGPSYYLTLPCRSFAQAVADISRVHDLPEFVFDLLREMRELRPSAEVVCLAEKRALLVRNAGRGV